MQIPILNGIFADTAPDFRTSYPKNLIPVPKTTGISSGYLRPMDGIIENGTGPGINRGGINWGDKLYRVMGSSLVEITQDGTVTTIGDVGNDGKRVTLSYSFDYLAVASNENLFLYDGTTFAQVTDVDLGVVRDVTWVDGYFMTTDGEFLVVNDLNDPFSFNPLKYGSSEADPDPVEALLRLRNEVYALNRYTIEVFNNVGGVGFPFARIPGAQTQKGCIGTHACCVYNDAIAFLGSGKNEAPSIYISANATTQKIATREIDEIIAKYTEAELAQILVEPLSDKSHDFLVVHLPNDTLIFDAAATAELGQPVWFHACSDLICEGPWLAEGVIWAFDRWNVAHTDTAQIGYLDNKIATHWGIEVGWQFGTQIIYNEGNGAIIHELELVAIQGNIPMGTEPTIWTQYSTDGVTWSVEKPIRAGKTGERDKRLVWFKQGNMRNWRIQRFRGTSESQISIARLEARLEPLAF